MCRGLHYVGTTLVIISVFGALVISPWFWLAAPFAGYGFAWLSHFLIEQNKPATFRYPLWSLRADFRMFGLAVQGRMADEVTKLYGSPHPAKDAPLRPRA